MEWGSNTIHQAIVNYAYHLTQIFVWKKSLMTSLSGCVTKLVWIGSIVAIRLMFALKLKEQIAFLTLLLVMFVVSQPVCFHNNSHSLLSEVYALTCWFQSTLFPNCCHLMIFIMIMIRTHFPSTTKLGFLESLAEVYWLLRVNSEVGHSSCLLNWEPLESSQTLHLSSLHFIWGDSDHRACVSSLRQA